MGLKNNHQITKNKTFLASLGHAWDGILDLLNQERNFRFHSGMALLVILAGLILRINVSRWLWILLAIFFVLITETVNTIVENVVNLIVGKHYNVIAKRIKDVAAGGVVIAALFAVVVGCLIFVPILLNWL